MEKLLAGKRIAIVGAADSAFNTGKGSYIDEFDIVIRINKAPLLLKGGTWKKDIGSKTDILFHSFFENEKSGGGRLDLTLYGELNIRYIVNPISEYKGYRVIYNFYKKYLAHTPVYSLPRKMYLRIITGLGNYTPTIGFCALHAVLQTNFAELYICGFTFFRTPFGEGYRNEMKAPDQVRQFIKSQGLHHPDLEYSVFKELLHQNSNKRILVDDVLAGILTSSA